MVWGSGSPKMDAELEEGEAYDDDTGIDPEIAFSYLDEKVQSVLGHFQKDFEGGVSAENLGAKFGGYGSFLPTYQRSPSIRSQPRSPQRVQIHTTTKSPMCREVHWLLYKMLLLSLMHLCLRGMELLLAVECICHTTRWFSREMDQ